MSNTTKLGIAGVCLVTAVSVTLLRGCGGYGKIDAETYAYAKALHSICSCRDQQRLQAFATQLNEAQLRGEVVEHEAGWLNDIVAQAETGAWEDATRNVRRMMLDQVDAAP